MYIIYVYILFFYSNALSCVFILNNFLSYDNDISLLDILSLADFAGCEQRASLCSNSIGAEMFFVSITTFNFKIQFKNFHSHHQCLTVGEVHTCNVYLVYNCLKNVSGTVLKLYLKSGGK